MTNEQVIETLLTLGVPGVICATVLALAWMFKEPIGARIRGEAAERAEKAKKEA
jgi:hypothetical protein